APTATIVRPSVTRIRESARETGSCKELDAQMTEGVRGQPDRPSAGESVMSTRTQRDIVFAHARIGYNKGHGSMQVVALKLDAYLPRRSRPHTVSGLCARSRRRFSSRIEGKRRLLRRHRYYNGGRRVLPPLCSAGLALVLCAVPARADGPGAEPRTGAYAARRGADVARQFHARRDGPATDRAERY